MTQHKDAPAPKPLPCPFCGRKPSIGRGDTAGHGSMHRVRAEGGEMTEKEARAALKKAMPWAKVEAFRYKEIALERCIAAARRAGAAK